MVGIDVTTILFLLHDDVTVQGRQRRLRLRDDADNMITMLLLLLALPNYIMPSTYLLRVRPMSSWQCSCFRIPEF